MDKRKCIYTVGNYQCEISAEFGSDYCQKHSPETFKFTHKQDYMDKEFSGQSLKLRPDQRIMINGLGRKPKKEKVKRPHFMGDTDVHKKDPPAEALPTPKMERFMTDSEWYKSELYRRLLPKKLKEERK